MRPQASRQRPGQPTAPHHSRHVPFTRPAPRSCPSFPSFPCSSQRQALRRQEPMRPQASRQRPRSATARRHSRHAPLTHPTPGLAPLSRHSPVQARGRLCAGRNPCDLKLPVSAPDQRRPAATHATLPCPTPPPVLPLFPVIPAQAGIHAISSLPSAPRISDGPPPLTPRSLHPPHPRGTLAPARGREPPSVTP